MKLYLCPANQVFQDMALSAMDYYYETSILSINGTGQSAFGDNYYDIPTTQIEVEIDDAEYIEIMAADRDHTLGRWWQLGAIITDDNDVRLFIGLIKNDSLKHTPTDNRFGFEVLDLLACMVFQNDNTKWEHTKLFERYSIAGNTDSYPVTYFTPQTLSSINIELEENIIMLLGNLSTSIGVGSMSGVNTQIATPQSTAPIYLNKTGEMPESTTLDNGTFVEFPYWSEGTNFTAWTQDVVPTNNVLKGKERFLSQATVKYRTSSNDLYLSSSAMTAIEISVYRRNGDVRTGYIAVYAAQFDDKCPLSCIGACRFLLAYQASNYANSVINIKTAINGRIGGISDKLDIFINALGTDSDQIIGGYKNYATADEVTVYTMNRDYTPPISYTNRYLAICSNAATEKPTIKMYGKCDQMTAIVSSQDYTDSASNLRDLAFMSNMTVQAKANTIYAYLKPNVNGLEISSGEDVLFLTDQTISSIAIDGFFNKYDGMGISGKFLFYSLLKADDDANKTNVLEQGLEQNYLEVFNSYNVKLYADLIGYYEFTAGQAISYQGKFYRVFAWEYDESSGTTAIDAYGRK